MCLITHFYPVEIQQIKVLNPDQNGQCDCSLNHLPLFKWRKWLLLKVECMALYFTKVPPSLNPLFQITSSDMHGFSNLELATWLSNRDIKSIAPFPLPSWEGRKIISFSSPFCNRVIRNLLLPISTVKKLPEGRSKVQLILHELGGGFRFLLKLSCVTALG